jgi:hypothetical protein
MARVAPIYTSFARGEVSPLMFGRIDLEQYPTLLDKCRNCWVRPYGVVSRFAGSEYINSTKDGNFARLIKFVFSADDSYIIEVGVGYFRFYYNGGVVLKDGEVYEVENSWTEEQIASLQYVQLDDIIKFSVLPVGSDNSTAKLMELVRKASDDWEFREVELKSTPYLDENITDTTITPSAATGDITLTASADLFEEGHIGSYWWIGGTVTEDDEQVQGYVQITKVESKTKALAKVIKKLSGTSATKRWGEGAWSNLRGYPAVVALYDGRIYYARTPHQPRNIYASKPYAYETFTPSPNNEDDGGLNIELATNANGDGSDIKWMIGASYLLCGTYGGEFIIRGTGDGAITPTDVSARQRTNWGGERIQPVVAGTFVHFVQRNGKKLRQFQYDYYYDSYKAVDVSIFSEHFFESGIKDIAYVKNTDSMLLLLNNNGEVVVLTLEQDQAIQAYSLLEFNGKVESIEVIPSHNGNYDEIWYVIKRNINGQEVRYLERIQDPITPDNQEDCWYVRSGLQYNAYNLTKDNELILSGLTGEITAIATNDIFEENDLNKRIRVIDEKGAVLGQATITKVTDAKSVNLKVVKDFQDTKIQGGLWGVSTNTISGLDHLENETVQILADGAVQTDKVVQEGKVLLELDAWKIVAGLGYTSYITTMPLEAGSQNGTAVGKRKRISELSVRLWKTSGCRIGRDLDNLQQVRYRTPNTPLGTPLGLFTGLIPNIKYNQGWEWVANVTVEQSSPLPMNILAIAPIMTEVDK